MTTSTEDKLVRVSIGGQVRAVPIRRSIFKIHSTRMGKIENGRDGGHTTDDGGCRE